MLNELKGTEDLFPAPSVAPPCRMEQHMSVALAQDQSGRQATSAGNGPLSLIKAWIIYAWSAEMLELVETSQFCIVELSTGKKLINNQFAASML